MSPTTISVRGRSVNRQSAERAIVHLTIAFDGADRQKILDQTLRVAESLRTGLEEQHDAASGPIVHWSSDRMRVWGERPWNEQGKQLPMVFHANLSFRVEWSEFSAMSVWSADVATTDGVQIGHIEWKLTDDTARAVEETVRHEAVADALVKARGYATALGLATIEPVELADVGLLGHESAPKFTAARMSMAMADMSAGAPELQFEPEDLEVRAEVEARFLAT